jgi:hypothetical protein
LLTPTLNTQTKASELKSPNWQPQQNLLLGITELVSSTKRDISGQIALEYSPLLSLWAITNAETLIEQEFSQLVYVFEFLVETHASNPYVGMLSEFSFEHDFLRVTKEA